MDISQLRKRFSSYETSSGQLRNVPDDILYEFLIAWEAWSGTTAEFYRSLGFTRRQMATLLGKAKRLKREGHFGSSDFKEVKIDLPLSLPEPGLHPCAAIEIVWKTGQIIRFAGVDHLLEFLKKSAA